MKVSRSIFATMEDGREVGLWRLETGGDAPLSSVELIDYGATLRSVVWEGREVVLGFDSLEEYQKQTSFIGASVGRFANRIAKATFTLDGVTYKLPANDGQNTLHGGTVNFSNLLLEPEEISGDGYVGVRYSITRPDGDQGFPGTLASTIEYILTEGGELLMYYRAQSDAPTAVNLTNHAYWNLAGAGSGEIYNHHITIPADHYVDVDNEAIPTGILAESDCGSGLMDLRNDVKIGDRIADSKTDGGLAVRAPLSSGYDHNYALNKNSATMPGISGGGHVADIVKSTGPRLAARVRLPEDGGDRVMEVYTSCPGIQFYSGNFLDGTMSGRGGKYVRHAAMCLETQYYPDSPNQSTFPNTILRPGEVFEELTVHRFFKK